MQFHICTYVHKEIIIKGSASGDKAIPSYRNMMITVFVFGALSSVLFHILTKEKKTSIDQHELTIAKSHSLQVVGVCMIYIIQLFNVIYLFVHND